MRTDAMDRQVVRRAHIEPMLYRITARAHARSPHHYLDLPARVNEADTSVRVMLLPRRCIPIYIVPMSARILRPTGVIVQASTRAMMANAM